MEYDKLWTGNIGDVADGYCIDSFMPSTELGRVIRLRQQATGELFLLTVLKKQTGRFWRKKADFLLEQMRFASEHFRHGNLQPVPLCGTFRDPRFFIMQECPYTLTQYIKASGGKLITPIALHIVFQMLDALEFLHQIPAQEAGTDRTCVTHDYLIPEHILLTDNGFAPTMKLSAQHKVFVSQDEDDPLCDDPVQAFYLPTQACSSLALTGRVKTNLWTVTALLHSMLVGLPDFDDPMLLAKKYQGEAFPAVNRRNLSVPQSLAKLIDTVLAQRDFPYDLTASEYKSMLEESAKKPSVRPNRVDDADDDNLLLDKGNSESRDKVLCNEALLISVVAPDLGADLPNQADAQDATPPICKQEYLPKGTRLFKKFEITSDTPEPDEFGWSRYSARRVQSEAVEQEYTVIQATRHYGTCFERLEQWRRLEHPNIRHMLAMGFHTGDTLVMVFEGPKNASDIWLENMASLRAQNWDGFIRDILDTALGCVRGLSFLHQNRMIHGDVKPSNLCGHGVNIKLNGLWLPENGGFTPAYASPEQFEDRAIDESTDVWNLGVTLVELLLGDRQWSKGPVCSLVYEEHLRIRCKPLPETIWSILRGCLQTDSSKRIRVDQLLELLECNRMEALPEPFEGYTRLNRLSDQSDVWVVRDEDGRNLVLKQFQSKLEAEQATRADKSLDFLYRYGHGTPEGNDLILRCFYRSSKYDYLKYCIMEYCPGGDLETWIQRSGPLPLATALFITEQLLDVLAFLHQGCFSYQYRDGLVYTGPVWHKHIEPKHILLMDDTACPEIRLKGFGDAVPKWDVIKGLNYAHMIPRDFSGFLCRDTVLSSQLYEPAGDVWAVAAVLYYMLTGKVPRNPETEGHGTRFSLEEINNLNVLPIRTRIPDIPVPLAEVIDDALREEPFNRQKAEEFWIKLKSACMNNQ